MVRLDNGGKREEGVKAIQARLCDDWLYPPANQNASRIVDADWPIYGRLLGSHVTNLELWRSPSRLHGIVGAREGDNILSSIF